jgi:hypothetical protein
MKTKNLTPKEAMELLYITEKPLPLVNGEKLLTVNQFLSVFLPNDPFFIRPKKIGGEKIGDKWWHTAEIEIPEGRNPDGITLAHLQMWEHGNEWRLLEDGESSSIVTNAIEYWNEENKRWISGCMGDGELDTYRTRKPKGYFLPESERIRALEAEKEKLTTILGNGQPQIADGCNPDGLTVDQIPEGRKLLRLDQIKDAGANYFRNSEHIWAWIRGVWYKDGYYGSSDARTYCIPAHWTDEDLERARGNLPEEPKNKTVRDVLMTLPDGIREQALGLAKNLDAKPQTDKEALNNIAVFCSWGKTPQGSI